MSRPASELVHVTRHRAGGVRGVAIALAVSFALPATARAQSDADARELAAYRLSMDALRKVDAAMQVMAEEMKNDPKFQAHARLNAEIEALEKKDERTEAEDAQLEELRTKLGALEDETPAILNDAKTLGEMEASIAKFPPLAKGLRAAGMPPREYAKFMMALIQAGMAAGMKKQGLIKELPKDVPPENVRFMEEHEADFKALQEKWQKLGKG